MRKKIITILAMILATGTILAQGRPQRPQRPARPHKPETSQVDVSKMVDKIMEWYDADKNGELSKEELTKMMKKRVEMSRRFRENNRPNHPNCPNSPKGTPKTPREHRRQGHRQGRPEGQHKGRSHRPHTVEK